MIKEIKALLFEGVRMEEEQKKREELEKIRKMLEEVQKEGPEQKSRTFKIELGRRYSSHWPIHLVVSLIINIILMFVIVRLFRLADIRNDLIFIPMALLFTAYEESVKAYLFRKQARLVIYTSGLIFFFSYVLFFYALDLSLFRTTFQFKNVYYPILFIVLYQVSRTMVKTMYLMWVKRLSRCQQKKQ